MGEPDRILSKELIQKIYAVVKEHGQDALLVGAAAFDFFPMKLSRRTLDQDFAVSAGSWDIYCLMRSGFEAAGIRASTKAPPCHFEYAGQRVDIVPFGGIAPNGHLHLPGMNSAFTVLGFEEAIETAMTFLLDNETSFKVACPEAVFVLKTFAFHDRRRMDDMADMKTILDYLCKNPDFEHYYAERGDKEVHKFERMGPWLLGRKIARMLRPETLGRFREVWKQILSKDSDYRRLFPAGRGIDLDERDGDKQDFLEGLETVLEGVHSGVVQGN